MNKIQEIKASSGHELNSSKKSEVRLFVRKLDYLVNEHHLREAFSEFGNVISTKVVMAGSKSRGYGFVSFSTPEEATKAIMEMNGKMLGRKPLDVTWARIKGKILAQQQEQEMSIDVPNVQSAVCPAMEKTAATQISISHEVKSMGEVHTAPKVQTAVCPAMEKTAATQTSITHEVKSTGEVHTAPKVQSAVCPAVKKTVATQTLSVVATLSDVVSDSCTVSDSATDSGPAAVKRKQQNNSSCACQNTHQPQNTQKRKLYVNNLDYSLNEHHLREEFSQFGNVISTKVVMMDGKSKGFGFVCFSKPEEATKAIMEMNGRMLGSRPMSRMLDVQWQIVGQDTFAWGLGRAEPLSRLIPDHNV